jgi:hypothetical protein
VRKSPCTLIYCQFLGFTTALCSESDGGSTSNVLMLIIMLYWSEKMIRNSMYLSPNTRLINKTSSRLTLITVFCFRVDPPSLLWRHMKPKNTVEPRITDIPLTYGHLFIEATYYICQDKLFSYKDTLLIRPIIFGPSLAVLTGFHCTLTQHRSMSKLRCCENCFTWPIDL